MQLTMDATLRLGKQIIASMFREDEDGQQWLQNITMTTLTFARSLQGLHLVSYCI